MHGLMMDYPLTVPALLRRTETQFERKMVVSRMPDRSLHRYTYRDCLSRSRRLAGALEHLGAGRGDRIGTLCWNHSRHLEAYYGVPAAGMVLHTLNLRLRPEDLAYVIGHGGDRVVIVDASLWPLFEQARRHLSHPVEAVVVGEGEPPAGAQSYEAMLASAGDPGPSDRESDEQEAAVLCYTSGTTGRPKGVLYTHRALVLHSLTAALADTMGLLEADVLLAVVPMFHANAWGIPFTAALVGASQVLPGPHMDAGSLTDLLERERVTFTAGVPTIWAGILQYLEQNPGRHDLSRLKTMLVGGAAAPETMIRAFDRLGINLVHAWGMTEMAPMGSISRLRTAHADLDERDRYRLRAQQGPPAPFVEIRARTEQGLAPWDGATMGELEVRGPWIAGAYFEAEEQAKDRWTPDGWFRTGDVVTLSPEGWISIQDRAKDLVKSGGEWICSIALESALAGHPEIAEAVVVAVPDDRWGERPLAVVVPKPGTAPDIQSIRDFLAGSFARWWLPDAVVHLTAIPRTGTGKYDKKAVRAMVAGQAQAAALRRST
jgi:fatty-acyl-CoA synthase